MYYSVVDKNGYIKLSLVTQDPTYTVESGERLLPDNPPDVNRGDYIPGFTKPLRIEPVPVDALEIPYQIVEDIQSTGDSEVTFVEAFKL